MPFEGLSNAPADNRFPACIALTLPASINQLSEVPTHLLVAGFTAQNQIDHLD
jgi:hypothetical protein